MREKLHTQPSEFSPLQNKGFFIRNMRVPQKEWPSTTNFNDFFF